MCPSRPQIAFRTGSRRQTPQILTQSSVHGVPMDPKGPVLVPQMSPVLVLSGQWDLHDIRQVVLVGNLISCLQTNIRHM